MKEELSCNTHTQNRRESVLKDHYKNKSLHVYTLLYMKKKTDKTNDANDNIIIDRRGLVAGNNSVFIRTRIVRGVGRGFYNNNVARWRRYESTSS